MGGFIEKHEKRCAERNGGREGGGMGAGGRCVVTGRRGGDGAATARL